MVSCLDKWMTGARGGRVKRDWYVTERSIIATYLFCAYEVLGCRYSSESDRYRSALMELMALATHVDAGFCFSRNSIQF